MLWICQLTRFWQCGLVFAILFTAFVIGDVDLKLTGSTMTVNGREEEQSKTLRQDPIL